MENIKKIIKEEINDFDWVSDIHAYNELELKLSDMLDKCKVRNDDDDITSYLLDDKIMFRYNRSSEALGVNMWSVSYPSCVDYDITIDEFDENIKKVFSQKFNLPVDRVRHVSWGS
jgi:hypothetical protein